jgi:hypothetical protein
VPSDSVRCTREDRLQTLHLREFSEPARYNSPDCPVYTGQCPVLQEDEALNSPISGIRNGCSAIIHRTCPVYTGLSGVTAGQRLLQAPTATCSALNARQRAQRSGSPMLAHRTPYSSCPVRHGTSKRAQKSELQRSEPYRPGDVAVAPDCPVHHTTDSFHQTASLVVGAINTPNHPTFKSSKFSTSQPLTRARHSILDTLK